MVVVQASKLSLPNPSLSSPHITSLLFEPNSLSLALMHSDSSFSLYPSLSPLRLSSSLPPPQTSVPAPSSSAAFVLLQNPNSPDSLPVFVVSGPYAGGSRILLRFFVLQGRKLFARARVVCNQKDLQFVERSGVLVDSVHGVSVKLAGSVNFFAMHSFSGAKVWIFAVKLVGDEVVKLMRCAVVECSKPVFSITLSFGFLILGEENGVRIFNLSQLVKGKAKKAKNLQSNSNSDGRKSGLPNGVIGADLSDLCGKCEAVELEGSSERTCNCYLVGKNHRHVVSVKQRAITLRQDSRKAGACFLAFSSKDVDASKSRMMMKAISIQALSPKKFLILDSAGHLHLLCWSNPVAESDTTPHMRKLPQVMNAQKLAVLADSSIRTQTVWLSDGFHSLHVIATSDIEAVINENDRTENGEKLMQISVVQAIFASEKIEDVIPLAANAILILGQVYMHMQFPKVVQLSISISLDSKMRPQMINGSLAEPLWLFSSKCFLHLSSGCYGSLRCYVAESTSCGFLINFDSENAVENTVLLEVIELGTCRMLVLEECFRKTYNLSQRTTSLSCRENTNLLAVGSPVFVHRCICMFGVLMSRWRDEPAIQLTSIIRSMQDGVMFDDTENF